MRQVILIFLILIAFLGCSSKNEKELKIATNSWIGYAPLFYAKEQGYLDELGIKLITTVSLGESQDIFSVGKADILTTTQHEYYSLKQINSSLKPIILMDRSYGGDMILSNVSLEELKNSPHIEVYMEIDSINSEMLKDFVKQNNLDLSKMIIKDGDQSEFQDLKNNPNQPTIIVTYAPYNISLKKKGFVELASTKDLNSIIVIDAICTTDEIILNYKERLKKLKDVVDRSIYEIVKDKKDAHKKISKYLNNITYKEFLESLTMIKWVNNPSEDLLKRIEPLGYKKEYLIE